LAAYLREKGWECEEFDVCNGSDQDLLDDVIWDALLERIKAGDFEFIVAGPPCETFSHARYKQPGPRPLGSVQNIYGLPYLKPFEKEQVRKANLCLARSAEACSHMANQEGSGFIIENPEPWDNCPTIFITNEFQKLHEHDLVEVVDFDQCPFGAESSKGTRFMFKGIHKTLFDNLRCNHPLRWFTGDDNIRYWARHPRQVGRKNADGSWATKKLAAWPDRLNQAIACAIVESKVMQKVQSIKDKIVSFASVGERNS